MLLLLLVACHSAGAIDAGPPAPKPATAPSAFERVDDALAMGTSKFASAADVEGRTDAAFAAYAQVTRPMNPEQVRKFNASDDERMREYRAAGKLLTGDHSHPGAFLARLGRLFGPPFSTNYTLRHRATGQLVTAYSAGSGPAYGAPIGADTTKIRPVIRELDKLVWAAAPVDSSFVLENDEGPFVTGVRDGGAFIEEVGVQALFDFYEPQVKSAGNPLDRASTATMLLAALAARREPLDSTLTSRAEATFVVALDSVETFLPAEAEDKREIVETLELVMRELKFSDPKLKARLKKLKE